MKRTRRREQNGAAAAHEKIVVLSPEAAANLDRIYDPVYAAVRKRLRLLTIYPLMGKALHGRLAGWRVTTVRMFIVIYRPTSLGIEVAHIRHGKRKRPTRLPSSLGWKRHL